MAQMLDRMLRAGTPLAGKWKLEILEQLSRSPARWSGLREALPEAAPNVLTRQLREMEQAGLLCRVSSSPKPPQVVEYRLTETGTCYLPLLSFPDYGACRRVLSSRWMLRILDAGRETPVRFGGIQAAIPGISRSVLAAQLQELRDLGLTRQTKYPCFPPRVEYQTTEKGVFLLETLAEAAGAVFRLSD